MVQYSVKKSRGRKIKKYRKSRRGKGRGKRSLKGGKTRRYKVFKNTKNHTLGKRKGKGRGRRMMGGVFWEKLEFWSDYHKSRIMNYINVKYKDKFQAAGMPLDGFKQIDGIGSGNDILGMFTNRSRGRFLREENKVQSVLIYSCHADRNTTILCFALVRVPFVTHLYETTQRDDSPQQPLTDAEKSKIPILGMNPKILFIVPRKSQVTNNVITDEDAKTLKKDVDSFVIKRRETLIKRAKINYAGFPDVVQKTINTIKGYPSHVTSDFGSYEFTSVISSDGDRYRVITIKLALLGNLLDNIITYQNALVSHPAAIAGPVVDEGSAAIVDRVVDDYPAANAGLVVDDESSNQEEEEEED